ARRQSRSDAIRERPRLSALGRWRGGWLTWWLLEQRAEGRGARGGDHLQAEASHIPGLLPRPRRGAGDQNGNAAVGGELRSGVGRSQHGWCDIHRRAIRLAA